MKKTALILLLFVAFINNFGKNLQTESLFVDSNIPNVNITTAISKNSYHIFSHGKPGYLFLDNKWKSAQEIATYFKSSLVGKSELYIYGCNFGAGKEGRSAIAILEKDLNIKINASNDVTGINGNWKLEIGDGKNSITPTNFTGNLQLDKTHYLNALIAGVYSDSSISEEFIYLSTPSSANITVQMNYASEIGSPRVSVTNLTTNAITYVTTGAIVINNSNPARLQFVTSGNAIIAPGTTPITRPLNTGGTIISGSTAGLKFTSTSDFFVNYRARSSPQAGSVLSKGVSALGKEFRWGGSPIEFPTTIAENGNMLSILATENATTVIISNIKVGTKFVNGIGGTTLTGPSVTRTLQKGESFILYAPVGTNALSIQDTGWLGAKVLSDKNVAVIVGGLLQQGSANDDRDIGLDQLVPVERLGLEHIIMKGNGLAREKVIVVSTEDNTAVYVNGSATPFTTLVNAGDYAIIPSTSFNTDRNMFVRVNAPSYVFHKIFGSDKNNTNSLMFIPPLTCFGQKSVDLIPDARKIGGTSYDGTELIVLAANGNANIPLVIENATTLSPSSVGTVTGNANWKSYRYSLTNANSNVKVSSTGTIQAEIIGANNVAGYGGYFSGFGNTPIYKIILDTDFDYPCVGQSKMTVISNAGGTFQWYRNDVAIPGATGNSYTLNSTTDPVAARYYVLVTFGGGCVVSSNQLVSDICPCAKPPATGTPDSFTKLGISIRDKRTTPNWPNDVGNGFLTMEANNKGFVITRIASPETAVQNPVLGMLVYDTLKDCLKLYNGTSWNCIKQTCN